MHSERPTLRRIVALGALAALAATTCADARSATIKSANGLARSAETAEVLLTSVCRSAELRALDISATAQDASDRLGAIQGRCHAAWQAYDRFRSDWLELSAALRTERAEHGSSDLAALLGRVEDDEERFVAAVNDVAQSVSGGAS